ncbi:MAG: NlpC/P60 family protein, partial [Dehalococcoidia bacterium]|nr:NlpC/P60 family protein [Dehalococcoidia bacterium]
MNKLNINKLFLVAIIVLMIGITVGCGPKTTPSPSPSPAGVYDCEPISAVTSKGISNFPIQVKDSGTHTETALRYVSALKIPDDLGTKAAAWAEDAAALAEKIEGAPYLGDGKTWGGKGWDWKKQIFVEPLEIKSGYWYYDARKEYKDNPVMKGKGVDCSGLVLWAYGKARSLTYVQAIDQIGEGGSGQSNQWVIGEKRSENFTDKKKLGRGDLILFSGHVAMYLGKDKVIHAKDLIKGVI